MGGGTILEHFSPKKVEYIHFVDSDDWLGLDCIEKCIEEALKNQADIVWHGYCHFDEIKMTKTEIYPLEKTLDTKLSPEECFSLLEHEGFSCVAFCLCSSYLLKENKIRFVCDVLSEDAIFGTQIFALACNIYLFNEILYTYRIRRNSLSKYHAEEKSTTFSPYQYDRVHYFETKQEAWLYDFCYARCIFVIEMIKFLEKNQKKFSNILISQLEHFIQYRAIGAFWVCKFKKDPKNARGLCKKIWSHSKYCVRVNSSSRLAFLFPKIYFAVKMILNYCKRLNSRVKF